MLLWLSIVTHCVGGPLQSCRLTYRTVQNLGDSFLLLHHVEILPQIRRYFVPQVLAVVHAAHVALLWVAAGQRQGQRPRCRPHVHQTHDLLRPQGLLFLLF